MDVQFLASLLVAPALLVVGCWTKKKKPKAKRESSKHSGKAKLTTSNKTSQKSVDAKPSPNPQETPKNNPGVVRVVKEEKKRDLTPFDEEYPEVPELTPSMKKKREKELEESRKLKIKKGFYQSKSDEDDTLEPIKSLKEEKSEEEFNRTSKKVSKKTSKKSKNRK